MLRGTLKLFGLYVPPEFQQLLDAVKENDITRLVIDQKLIDKFGGYYERDKVVPWHFERLAEAQEHNTSVKTLEISGYMIPATYQLVSALKKNKTINSVIIDIGSGDHSQKELLADILLTNKSIKHIMICCCCISDDTSVQRIAESLAKNKTLQVLELNRAHVLSQSACDAISRIPFINNTLEKIVLYAYERQMQPGDKPFKEFHLDTPRVLDLLRDKTLANNTLFRLLPRDISEELLKYLRLPVALPNISRLRSKRNPYND